MDLWIVLQSIDWAVPLMNLHNQWMDITIKCKVIGYWLQLVTCMEDLLSHGTYNSLLNMYNRDIYKLPRLDIVYGLLNSTAQSLTSSPCIISKQP